MKLISATVLTVIFVVFCSSCESSSEDKPKMNQEDQEDNATLDQEKDKDEPGEENDVPPQAPVQFAKYIAHKISNNEFEGWSEFSGNEVFFSPYSFIDTNLYNKLKTEELPSLYRSDKDFVWGIQDGTGDTLEMTFKSYLNRYVKDFEITDTSIVSFGLFEELTTRGNELHNAKKIYPGALFVEAHKPADDEMGMNWKSLIFVIEKGDAGLRLLGLIHNEWTI